MNLSYWLTPALIIMFIALIFMIGLIYHNWEVHDAMYCVEHMCSLAEQGLG